MSFWVYIIYSESTDSYYRGQAEDLAERIKRHNHGWEKATQNGIPWKLVWNAEKPDRSSAVILEKKLKNLSKKRLTAFIAKYDGGVASPDDPDR
jgi:putative endonuclease